MGFLLKGICIGLLFGLPAGAVGALTVQRTLHSGIRAGLFTGLGSSVADCFYASVGAFGITLISDFLLQNQNIICLLGGGLILLMGIGLLLRKETAAKSVPEAVGIMGMFLSSFAIGITNPAAILTFLFAFSWFGIAGGMALLEGLLLVCGIFLGTYLWWGILTVGADFSRKRTRKVNFRRINQVFGCILCLLGIAVFLRTAFNNMNLV